MTSAVDVENDGGKLAKQYILKGGILGPKIEGKYIMKAGVGDSQSNAYNYESPKGTLYNSPNARAGAAGLKPMPGITSIDIKSGAAYGSLRTVTVNFVCHNIQQLEDLELLYMRPGYTALVEWGWAPYLNKDGKIETNIDFYDNVLNGDKTKEQVFLELYQKSVKKEHNYDAMYGYVKNYNWTARMDGGYNCQTTIVSIGEIMESLKVGYIPFNIDGVIKQKGLLKLVSPEDILLPPGTNKTLQSYSKNILAGLCQEIYSYCAGVGKGDFPKLPKQAATQSPSIAFYDYDLFRLQYKTDGIPNSLVTSDMQIYITLESFVQLLNDFVLLYNKKATGTAKPFITISTNSNAYETGTSSPLLCLAHPLQVSIDPTVCLITNDIWAKGVTFDGVPVEGNTSGTEYLKNLASGNIPFENKNETGFIGNIYLNVDFLYRLSIDPDLLDQKTQELKLYDYLIKVLKNVQESIGGVNNFEIHVDPIDNVARIIDLNYVDDISKIEAYNNAYQIEMHNLSGSIRSYDLQSQIFPDQANMIAIGAQVQATSAQGTAASSLLDFNNNLYDRILGGKDDSPSSKPFAFINNNKEVEGEKFKSLKTNINTLHQFFFPDTTIIDPESSQQTSEYKTALKNIITYFQDTLKSNTSGRAIIPVKISLTMDGIGGLVIGHLFKIPLDLLPRGYGSDNVGGKLIQTITSIGHKIENGDWTTTIDALNIVTKEPSGIGDKNFNDLLTETKTGYKVAVPSPSPKSTAGGLNYPLVGNYTKLGSGGAFNATRNSGKPGAYQHGGVDLAVAVGTPVYAVEDGIATIASDNTSGNYVQISHGQGTTGLLNGYTTYYFHLSSQAVSNGKVTKGQVIGYSGGEKGAPGAGRSDGPHLHFEIRATGTRIKIDPGTLFFGL
jgi:hypothetical protein